MPSSHRSPIMRGDPNREQLFWDRVDKTGGPYSCWPYLAARTGPGYGSLTWDGKSETAHRVALFLSKGQPNKGEIALHSCDNPPCCNPLHLSWGTYKENTRQAFDRGRRGPMTSLRARGEQHPVTKLTSIQVAFIRDAYPTFTQSRLAKVFGVRQPAISYIVNRINWRPEDVQ